MVPRVQANFPFSFESPLEFFSFGDWGYNVVYLPEEFIAELPLGEYPRLRIRGQLGNASFAGAWQPTGQSRWYLMVSKALLAKSGYRLGDIVRLRFRVDDQDAVDIPDTLAEALEADRKAQKAWEALTPGKRRGLAHMVSCAKTFPTQQKRCADILAILRGEKDLPTSKPKRKS
ncbi:MAG: hypothetical protein OHK0021_06600 [Bryobacter sp.]